MQPNIRQNDETAERTQERSAPIDQLRGLAAPRGLAAVAWLRSVVARMRSDQLTWNDRAWLADILDRTYGKSAIEPTMEDCLRISTQYLYERWQQLDARNQRDVILRKLWKEFYGGVDLAGSSRKIAEAAKRYDSGAWRREDKRAVVVPKEYSDADQRRWLFAAFKAHDIYRGPLGSREFPCSAKQIKRILRDVDSGLTCAREGRELKF